MPKVILTSHEKDVKRIGDALAGAIGEKRIKQREIAEKLGRTQPSISSMLRNLENMRLGDLLRICEMTDRTVEIVRRGR